MYTLYGGLCHCRDRQYDPDTAVLQPYLPQQNQASLRAAGRCAIISLKKEKLLMQLSELNISRDHLHKLVSAASGDAALLYL